MTRIRSILALALFASTAALLIQPNQALATVYANAGALDFQSTRTGQSLLYTINPVGTNTQTVLSFSSLGQEAFDVAWSPDGSKIAFDACCSTGNSQIYTANADGSGLTQLTSAGTGNNTQPAWAPGGNLLAFVSDRDGNAEIYSMLSDGTAQTNLTNDPSKDEWPAWSPDGTKVAFDSNRSGKFQIYWMKSFGNTPTNLSNSTSNDVDPDWSPHGEFIIFQTNRTGNDEIFSMNSADGSNQIDLTNDAGSDRHPVWCPDAARIAFDSSRSGNRDIWVMDIDGSNQVNVTNASGVDQRPSWQPLLGGQQVVIINSTGFTPASVVSHRGDIVEWDFFEGSHSADDASGMELFGSGMTPEPGAYAFIFTASGTYAVVDSATGLSGTVKVGVSAVPQSGTTTTVFTITWASTAPPSGFVIDVQVKRPGHALYEDWQSGVTTLSATFTPDAGVGRYLFRGRIRNSTNGKSATYSAPTPIQVS